MTEALTRLCKSGLAVGFRIFGLFKNNETRGILLHNAANLLFFLLRAQKHLNLWHPLNSKWTLNLPLRQRRQTLKSRARPTRKAPNPEP